MIENINTLKRILSYCIYIYTVLSLISVPGAEQKEDMYLEFLFNLFFDVFTWRNVREYFCKTHPQNIQWILPVFLAPEITRKDPFPREEGFWAIIRCLGLD